MINRPINQSKLSIVSPEVLSGDENQPDQAAAKKGTGGLFNLWSGKGGK